METKFVVVTHDNMKHHVCFYAGANAKEMSSLISSLFKRDPRDGVVVGLSNSYGDYISLGAACKSPELLSSSAYKLEFENSSSGNNYNNTSYSTASDEYAHGGPEYGEEDEDPTEHYLEFADLLLSENQIDVNRAALLKNLILSGSEDVHVSKYAIYIYIYQRMYM